MRIRLADESLLPDLLSFMRASGCLAYYAGDGGWIEVVRPHAFGEQEASEVGTLLFQWSVDHPEANAEIVA